MQIVHRAGGKQIFIGPAKARGGRKCMRMYMEFCLHRFIYTMMSWLHEGPMEEHVAVEFWSESGPPGKCLQTLSLQFSKIADGCKLILSAR